MACTSRMLLSLALIRMAKMHTHLVDIWPRGCFIGQGGRVVVCRHVQMSDGILALDLTSIDQAMK